MRASSEEIVMCPWRAGTVLVALTLMSLASCGDDDGASDSTTPTMLTTPTTTEGAPAGTDDADLADPGCDAATTVEPGSYEHSHMLDEVEQPYRVVVPDTYGSGSPAGLFIVVPGGSGSAEAALAGWGPTLTDVDALVAFVEVGRPETRTVPMIRALIDDVADRYCVDRYRVYATGSSASAGFTSRLMADASDVIAAFAPGIGMFGTVGLDPIGPVPLIAWSGDPDRGPVERSVADWAASNGCEPEPIVSDLGSGVAHHQYEGCSAPTEYYDFAGMGHQIPMHDCGSVGPEFCAEYDEFDFWDDVGRFFDANPLPAP
jgi:poly(3-hydroxybutyrate) depolymerase